MPSNEGTYVTIDRSSSLPTPTSPYSLVQQRFEETLDHASNMVELLTGSDGESGFLGELNDSITSAPAVSISVPTIDSSIVVQDIGEAPTFSDEALSDYPTDEYSAPSLDSIPSIDSSGIEDIDAPEEVTATIIWSEAALSTDVYTPLLARLQDILTDGSTGLDSDVEAAIYARARARQVEANDRAKQVIENDIANRNFSMPSGALNAALARHATDALAQETDVNNTILIEQGKLAQENTYRAMEIANVLEGLIRQTKSAKDLVTLDNAKEVARIVLQSYAENIKAYVAKLEGKKLYVEAQVENLRGVIEANKGKIEIFKEQWGAFEVQTNAVSAKNKGLIDVFLGKITAFSEKAKAVREKTAAQAEVVRAEIAEATFEINAAIEEARLSIEGYSAEGQLKTGVAKELANIASQSVASAFSAVNAGATIGYSGQESKSETWGHRDSLGEDHNFTHNPTS